MSKTTAAARLFVGLWAGVFIATPSTAAAAPAQAPANPTQQTVSAQQDQLPVFRVTVVGRSIPAVNYRPRHGDTRIDFAGTALMPKAKGYASVEGDKGYITIKSHFDEVGKASQFGREYLTYVLWAITPEGRATNLGELQIKGDDGRLNVTTELQAFALVVTAEPYFAVTQPSDVVVMENVVREHQFESTKGTIETVQAKYELLKRGSYLLNQDPARVKIETPKPGDASDLAQAHNAVEFARLAGADRYASDTFGKAQALLAQAEQARKHGGGNKVMQPARQAAQTAEDARLIALQRQEEAFQAEQKRLAEVRAAEERRLAAQREADARDRIRAEEERRRAEEDRRRQAELQASAADAARLAAEQQRLDAERQRAEADRVKADAERARLDAERAKAEADAARANAERQAQDAANAAAQAERDRAQLREQLRQQLNVILETRETARGLIVNVSDVLFDFNQATLKPGAREKLAKVAGILGSHPGLKIEIEGHTDSIGTDDYNQRLSERRAQSVAGYLTQQGAHDAIVGTVGFGESRPVATNGTAAGRQQNRRVEIVVSGEPIAK
jgi:outer membrane protein OmpA-like peptidoglycan-associated protein